ncbi:protein AMBP-like isoform X2 [Toxotes jaculatrix]|uniref:protein AMBP-like isoform X2 n=1 Tax=Toxotes jaculatrix TaxID=941984 RepID=UPI001B3A9DFF|nr:protein AMBP-like isoform X2 [Toxotes jaculatrix]XP_040915520.1 protein AMBP-like isoform X2 [Toxotes jaculatrix]
MQSAAHLVSLLILGSAWTLHRVHMLPENLPLTQENFDLGLFMGQWYEVAVVSTCPHYMQRKRRNPVIVALELQHVASESNFTMMATTFRNGSCKQTSTDYSLTNTPGRFFHHVARFGADVDSYVVHTNYDEYAMMLLLSTEKPSGNKTTTVKLYSRTMDVSPVVMDNFKARVTQHGISEGTIIMNQNKNLCVPDEPVTETTTQPQIHAPKRSKRNVVPPVDSTNI